VHVVGKEAVLAEKAIRPGNRVIRGHARHRGVCAPTAG
jgi:hypothetical protein